MGDFLKEVFKVELASEAGRIDLAAGLVLAAAVVTLYAGEIVTEIGDFILRLMGKKPAPDTPNHKLAALGFLFVYFLASVWMCTRNMH